MDDKPEQIKGAKLVGGKWQDLDGNPLSNAELMRLREAQESEKEAQRKERERAARERARAKEAGE